MKILFISLGCDKNLVDSEVMLGLIRKRGIAITNDENEADIIVVNTCCFINDAKEESVNTILEMSELKNDGSLKALIVTGCLAQRYQEEIQNEIPEVDAILGTSSYENILDVIDEVLIGKKIIKMDDINNRLDYQVERVNTTGGFYSYLKIAEGCDKHCTYCIIPKVRGNYRSRPMEKLIKEASDLAAQGVKELILVAQETTLYGMDLYGDKKLPDLLKELVKIEGIEWVRLLYCYPEEITDELIQVIKSEVKICNYLDIPIQHASDTILKKMGRRTTKQDLIQIIHTLREEIPDICLRTTIISGFPGESEQDHEEVMSFVDQMNFDRLGVFCYSPEEDTPAAKMDEQVEETIKETRKTDIMALQQDISYEISNEMIGKTIRVMIEGKLPEDNVYIGRTYKDAPNVDGFFFVTSERELMSGDFIYAKVTEAREYDLVGEINE